MFERASGALGGNLWTACSLLQPLTVKAASFGSQTRNFKEKSMFIADVFGALVFGLVIVFILSLAFGTKGPWGSFLWFFVVVALFAWVGGVWLRPYGPVWMGVGWLPIIFVGFLVAMLLTAASPRNPNKSLAVEKETVGEESRTAVGVFFWVLIVCLLMFGMSHYYWYPQIG